MLFKALSFATLLAVASSVRAGLTQDEADDYIAKVWTKYAKRIVAKTSAELEDGAIEVGDTILRFSTLQFTDGKGEPCTLPCEAADGEPQPLFISLHGGGSGPAKMNDQQWQNQIALGKSYAPQSGLYLAPRAPTDTWDCWHSAAVDPLLERLIRALVATGTVDANRVYLMGYSAGGDGVYALAPRLADRFAAASMMAGHPNGIQIDGLRNLPFSIQVGAKDNGYDRANVARQYGAKLDRLEKDDPEGYTHFTTLHKDKPHWMDREDRVAVPWMEQYTRTIAVDRIVWRQVGIVRHHFYWLAIPEDEGELDELITADLDEQTITLSGPSDRNVIVHLNDEIVDLDRPIRIEADDGSVLFKGKVERMEEVITQTINAYGDPDMIFTAQVEVTLP